MCVCVYRYICVCVCVCVDVYVWVSVCSWMGGQRGDLISGIFEAAPETFLCLYWREDHTERCPRKRARPEEKDEGRQSVQSRRAVRSETPEQRARKSSPGHGPDELAFFVAV